MKLIKTKDLKTPTQSAHAATVVYWKGTPVYAWFGGSKEGAPDVRIYIKYRQAIIPLGLRGVQMAAWNPILTVVEGRLFLFFKLGIFCDQWQTFIIELVEEAGKISTGTSTVCPAGVHGPVKTAPIVEGNKVICGSSVETHFRWTSYIEELALTGDEWSYKTLPPIALKGDKDLKGLIQPTLWRRDDGKLCALMRSCRESPFAWYAEESDDGWTAAEAAHAIRNPNSGLDVVKHSNGKLYLISNPSSTLRTPLAIVELDGLNPVGGSVIIDSAATGYLEAGTREVSYPYAIEAPNGDIIVAYTYRRKTIKVARIAV
jgi:predicted neuraminidase